MAISFVVGVCTALLYYLPYYTNRLTYLKWDVIEDDDIRYTRIIYYLVNTVFVVIFMAN